MRAYRCKSRFFCTPLKRYVPRGAIFGRYENITKLVMNDNPSTEEDPFGQLVDGFEYDDPAQVTWIYAVEPPPLGTDNSVFTDLGRKDEDEFSYSAIWVSLIPQSGPTRAPVCRFGLPLRRQTPWQHCGYCQKHLSKAGVGSGALS